MVHVVTFQPALLRFRTFVTWCERCSHSYWERWTQIYLLQLHSHAYYSTSLSVHNLGQYTFCMVLELFSLYIGNSFLHSIQIGETEKCFFFLNLPSDRNFMYLMGIIDMIWSYVNFYNMTFFVQRTLIPFQKSLLNRHDRLPLSVLQKNIIHKFFQSFVVVLLASSSIIL